MEHDFINKITGIIEENLSDEKFGVSELAGATGMSRSNLLRKIKKTTKLSASQFIRQVRLQHAMELLKANFCECLRGIIQGWFWQYILLHQMLSRPLWIPARGGRKTSFRRK